MTTLVGHMHLWKTGRAKQKSVFPMKREIMSDPD